MAKIGFKLLAWAKILSETSSALPTFDTGKIIGKAISANLAVTNAEGTLYADNEIAEEISEFSSALLTAEAADIALADLAALYGADYVSGELQFGGADNAPYGGLGGYQVVSVNNVRKYRAYFMPKGKATVPDETDNTKTNSISFGTQPLRIKFMTPLFGKWRYIKEFATEAAARAYVETKLNVAVWHEVNVQVNGAGAGESASPTGITYAANAGSFALTITGTPTALYDNGVDVVESIADGVYTIASVTAAHNIAVIF
jgi:hypothetical protein